jgi:hypothetical protein
VLGDDSDHVLPSVIVGWDMETKTVSVARRNLTVGTLAVLHRWEERSGASEWTVECPEEDPFTCSLWPHEAANLTKVLVSAKDGIWLDYVCINASTKQVRIK